MQTSTPQTPKPVEPKSILLIGPPGGGKTTLAMGFPNVAFMDLDRNLDGPDQYLRKKAKKADLSYGYEQVTYKDGLPVPPHEIFDRLMDCLLACKSETNIKTVVIDSLTLVNEAIIQKVLKQQGKTTMELQYWGPFKSQFVQLLAGRLRFIGKTIICTCHEYTVSRSDPKNMMHPIIVGYKPAISSEKLQDVFGGFFTDMIRCTAEPAAQSKIEYKLECHRTTLSDLKNSVGLPPTIIVKEGEVAYDKIKQYYEV